MSSAADESQLDAAQLADLSALADGSLDPARRDEVEARIAASPELSATYERERRAVEMLHHARATDRAPLALKQRIEAQRPSARQQARRRLGWGGALATGLAALALALVLILPSGTPGAPSVSEAAALALRGPIAAAPTPDPDAPHAKLQQDVGGVYFPNWAQQFGWKAVGRRVDHVGSRLAVTVYYQWRNDLVAYTIVSAPALKEPAAKTTRVNDTDLRTLTLGGRQVVTWRRNDHTCVLSSTPGVPVGLLQRMAAWSGDSASA